MAKRMKKLLSLVLVLSMLLSMGSAAVFADTEEENSGTDLSVIEVQNQNEDETLTEGGSIPKIEAENENSDSTEAAAAPEVESEEAEEIVDAEKLAIMSLEDGAPDYKVQVKVSSTLDNGDVTTVTGTVYDDYSATLVLPDARVNAGNVTVSVSMKDIASMGIKGEKTHEATLSTGATSGSSAALRSALGNLYDFENATVNAVIKSGGETAVAVYEFTGTADENGTVITATTDTASARTAWQLMMKDNFEFVTDKAADSYIVIANGSSMQIGNEKLVFEDGVTDDIVLDNLLGAGGMGAANTQIRDMVRLDTVADSAVTFTLKAGTELAVDQSSAKLLKDVTVTVDVDAAELNAGNILSTLRDADSVDELLVTLVGALNTVVGAIDGQSVDVTVEFAEEPVVKDYKVKVDVSSKLNDGTVTTVTGTVYDDYSAELVLPDAAVNAGNVTVSVSMKNIASMGINGEKTHQATLSTGATSGANAALRSALGNLYDFENATVNAVIKSGDEAAAVVYEFTGAADENGTVITATTDTVSARTAWQLMMKDNFEFVTDKAADSYIVIANGSSMQIGNEKLVFEDGVTDDIVLDNLLGAGGMGAANTQIRDMVRLDTVADSAVTFTLKAGTELAVDQSSAKLLKDVTVTVDVDAAELNAGNILSTLRDADSVDELLVTLVGALNTVVGAIDGKSVGVTIEFTCSHTEDEGEVTIPAECTKAGERTFRCTKCGEDLRTETIDALGHETVIDEAKAATCTETGLTEGSHCSRCEEVLIAQEETAALGHTEVIDAAVAPTCGTAGLTEGVHCSVCNEVITAQETVAATGEHIWDAGVVTTPAQVGVEGERTFTCTVCEATRTEPIPALPRRSGGGSSRPVTPPTEITDPEVPLAEALPFDDVKENIWFREAVQFVYANNLMNGAKETKFEPYEDTTRGMIVTILWRLEGEPTATSPAAFTDVADDKYYAKAVDWAVENGIVTGYDDEIFAPERNISRQEMAAILYRYADFKKYDVTGRSEIAGFADANEVQSYAEEAVKWSVNATLIKGRDNNKIAPVDSANRAEVATILMRFVNSVVKTDAETK